MIKSRNDILKLNNCFAEHLLSVQKAKHEPSEEWNEGDTVILDDSDKPTVLTKEQADNLNQEDLEHYLKNRDDITVEKLHDWDSQTTLISSKQTIKDYFYDISFALIEITKEHGNLIIMGDWNTPWLNQNNDYPPVLEALNFLKTKIDFDFNGGFYLTQHEIKEFIPHLFWLTRCNASLPQFMMSFEKSKTILNICKNGVLHFEFYDSIEKHKFLRLFKDMKFIEINSCNDPIDFDKMGERQIVADN
ncbi:hypothetical protein [Reichenbachiella sp. MSK19-1]|uniref:hypothetical protein n=1 Tax=Reichenbachiella sp. MSK19-1 TaxID=1897631 RepID=UPI000E6CBABB|nr:hypothetical protein [Reichenbachiella sp. MSK19-1]RJE75238.1 hypothetical protein BGP76_19250 [Reichenbachiella sp. MSK19-1]